MEELQFVPLVEFAQPAAHRREVFARQLRQFRNNFSRSHGKKLNLARKTGKRGFMQPPWHKGCYNLRQSIRPKVFKEVLNRNFWT